MSCVLVNKKKGHFVPSQFIFYLFLHLFVGGGREEGVEGGEDLFHIIKYFFLSLFLISPCGGRGEALDCGTTPWRAALAGWAVVH